MKKTIFITGASKGIGKATALYFAKRGWFVGITDIDKGELDKLGKELDEKSYFSAVMDVTDIDCVTKTIDEFCSKTAGRINVLFNNAGIGWIEPFESMPISNWQATVNVNAIGVLNCTYQAFPYLRQTLGARVINMGSASAHYGVPIESVYSATKFFIRGLTEALNIEWERYGIHVCDLMPNFVDTPMMEKATHSNLVNDIGIKLTAQDVVKKVWKAANKNRVHWLVEIFPYTILQPLSQYLPRSIVRDAMKKKSGL